MSREVIKVIRKEQGQHLITYVLLDDGTEASVYGEAKVGDKMMVYFHEKWNMVKAERIKDYGGEGAAGETTITKTDQESR